MSSIFTRFGKWVAGLFHTAENHWNDLPTEDQQAVLNGSIIPQIIKNNLEAGETVITGLIIDKTGLPPEIISTLLEALYKEFNVATLSEYQNILKSAQGSLWAGLLETSAKILAGILSKGKITWESLGLGLLTYAYNKFVKGT